MMNRDYKTPVGAAPPDWRGLCEVLVNELHGYASANPHHDSDALVARARAALAEPEPEAGPTDEELRELFTEIDQSGEALSWRAFARAVLARWGRPAPVPAEGEVAELVATLTAITERTELDPFIIKRLTRAANLLERHPVPVPVAERLPGPEDCDAEGRCWWFWKTGVEPVFVLCSPPPYRSTHWLPAHALPLPQGEVE